MSTKYQKKFGKYNNSSNYREELIKNNYDYNHNLKPNNHSKKNYNIYDSRKYSKDSSTISTSNEDLPENNEIHHNNYNFSFNSNANNTNDIYKGNASDFKKKYKTELCKFYEMTGKCKYGDSCAYAHGKENLRSKVTNTTAYRTKKCVQFFENGYCPYGSRCQFQHQLKNNIINNPYDNDMSYQKILEIISKFENVRNIKKLVEKPRLKIFKEITGNNTDNENKSRLLDDIKELDRYINTDF